MRVSTDGQAVGEPIDADRRLRVRIAALSDVGTTRDENQDDFLLWHLTDRARLPGSAAAPIDLDATGLLLAACDGMGGVAGGREASALAVATLAEHAAAEFREPLLHDPAGAERWLVTGVNEAHRKISSRAEARPDLQGMGTTLTAAALLGSTLVTAHVGDSRAYHLRDGRFRQLTLDHSFVGQLVAMGRISVDQARRHESSSLLLQVVGSGKPLNVDTMTIPLRAGDRLLLCSDGLHGLVSDAEMEEVLAGPLAPEQQCQVLVDAANGAGGVDNITVLTAHIS